MGKKTMRNSETDSKLIHRRSKHLSPERRLIPPRTISKLENWQKFTTQE